TLALGEQLLVKVFVGFERGVEQSALVGVVVLVPESDLEGNKADAPPDGMILAGDVRLVVRDQDKFVRWSERPEVLLHAPSAQGDGFAEALEALLVEAGFLVVFAGDGQTHLEELRYLGGVPISKFRN